ncbi:MAG: Stp1/IreP family PP2C-type Ser/Thr phosphatase [Thermodesulfobacteriota bacterium]
MLSFQVVGKTDTGCIRNHNEDAFLIRRFDSDDSTHLPSLLAVVADGVGGRLGGRQASSASVNAIREFFETHLHDHPDELLIHAIEESHRFLKEMSARDPELKGMGTTCTAVWASGIEAYVGHVGDSRAYLIRNGESTQITEDHTLVHRLLKEGKISDQEALNHPDKNIILQAVGASDAIDVDLFHVALESEDILLLCSDGLHGLVTDHEMAELLGKIPLDEAPDRLISLAKERGGHDNITTVIIKAFQNAEKIQPGEFQITPDASDTKKHPVVKSRSGKKYRIIILFIFLILFGIISLLFYFFRSSILPGPENQAPALPASQKID